MKLFVTYSYSERPASALQLVTLPISRTKCGLELIGLAATRAEANANLLKNFADFVTYYYNNKSQDANIALLVINVQELAFTDTVAQQALDQIYIKDTACEFLATIHDKFVVQNKGEAEFIFNSNVESLVERIFVLFAQNKYSELLSSLNSSSSMEQYDAALSRFINNRTLSQTGATIYYKQYLEKKII